MYITNGYRCGGCAHGLRHLLVVGDGAHPFYRWAATTLGQENVPAWNFHKYLVARDGHLIGSFRSEVTPDSTELRGAIERALSDKMTAAK